MFGLDCKGHVTNHQRRPISYLHANFEQNRSINTKVTFKGRCGLCLAFDCKGHVTNYQRWPISNLHAKFEQNRSINTKVTYKGRCGLCLAFVCKGHVTIHQRLPISYLHAKFKKNRSINTKVTFLKATAAFIWPLIVKAAAPTLTLKVLINFGVGLVTGY